MAARSGCYRRDMNSEPVISSERENAKSFFKIFERCTEVVYFFVDNQETVMGTSVCQNLNRLILGIMFLLIKA